MGTHMSSQQELSNEFQHDRVKMVFKKSLHLCALDERLASALDGLRYCISKVIAILYCIVIFKGANP